MKHIMKNLEMSLLREAQANAKIDELESRIQELDSLLFTYEEQNKRKNNDLVNYIDQIKTQKTMISRLNNQIRNSDSRIESLLSVIMNARKEIKKEKKEKTTKPVNKRRITEIFDIPNIKNLRDEQITKLWKNSKISTSNISIII